MRSAAWPALAMAVVAAVLAPMLGIGFVNDDYTIVTFALHRGRPLLEALLSRAEVIEVYYRPLFDLSLALEHRLWGWTPSGFRLTNLALHLLNTYLVYRLALRLGFARAAALVALVVFGLHPIHETSLYWIAGRTDVLCAAFMLASLLLVRRSLALSLLFCVLAMLSKEMALSLPLVVACVVGWLDRERPVRERLRHAALEALPYALAVSAVIVVRAVALDNDLFGAGGVHGGVSVVQIVRNVATYVGLLVIPGGHESIEAVLRGNPLLFIALAIILLAAAAVVLVRWRRPLAPLLFCAAAMFATMIPVLRLMMRWYLYIPSIFFAIAVGWLVWRLRQRSRRAAMIATTAIAIGYAAIDMATIDAWVRSSEIAGRLGDELANRLAPKVRAGDTLLFLSIPGKLDQAPIFNLGFAGTVRHLLAEDSLTVLTATKLNMTGYPTRVETTRTPATGAVTLQAGADETFGLVAADVIAQRHAPERGDTVRTEAGRVVVLATGRGARPRSICVLSDGSGVRTWTLSFDGRQFVMLP